MDKTAVAAFLASDEGAEEVRAEAHALVHQHNVSGVPHFIIDGKIQFSGAQEAAVIAQSFERVLASEG